MHIPTIQRQFDISQGFLQANLEGFNDANASQNPNGGNSAVWLVSHIIAARQAPLMFTGSDTVWQADTLQRWIRSPNPLQKGEAPAWNSLIADLDASQGALTDFLANADDALLNTDTPVGKVSEMLAFLAIHEAYHVGQVAMLRRVFDLPGVLK